MPGVFPGDLAKAAVGRWGSQAAASQSDGSLVLMPATVDALSAMLAWAGAEDLAIVPRGAGSHSHHAASDDSRHVATVSLASMTRVVEHCAGDMTATIEAGASLGAVNEALAREGQWLALDPPHAARATIGGIVASDVSGPRRLRFGSPRDQIIGVQLVLADGRIVKAGGRVVKNVAGYDLSRLVCGSFGRLAVIATATFKIAPLAHASRTVVARVDDVARLADLAIAAARSPLEPAAVEADTGSRTLLVRFESTPGSADHQANAVAALCKKAGADAALCVGDAERDAWTAYAARCDGSPATRVKLSVLPTSVSGLLQDVEGLAARHGLSAAVRGRAALGVLVLDLDGSDDAQAAVLAGLRERPAAVRGTCALLTAPPRVEQDLATWVRPCDAVALMQAVEAQFDPKGVLRLNRRPPVLWS